MENKPAHLAVNSVGDGVKQDVRVRAGCEFPWSPVPERRSPEWAVARASCHINLGPRSRADTRASTQEW